MTGEQLIGIGRTAEVYDLGEGKVLKLILEGMPNHWIEHEASILESVSTVCRYAPAYYGTETRGDRLGLIMERVNGRTALDILNKRPLTSSFIIQRITAVQRDFQNIKADGIPDGRDGFHAALNGFEDISSEERDILRKVIDRGASDKLCHGDYHPDNVIFDEDMNIRIIDWITAYRGDPVSDAARSYYLIRHGKGTGTTAKESNTMILLRRCLSWRYLRCRYPGKTLPDDFDGWHALVMIKRLGEDAGSEEAYIRYKIPILIERMKEKESQNG